MRGIGLVRHLRHTKNKGIFFTKKAFEIYGQCMYEPTPEKYEEKMKSFLKDKNVDVFTCYWNEKLVGVIVLHYKSSGFAEIMGIAVDKSCKYGGIGSFMIEQVMRNEKLTVIEAETDNDAIGFYEKNGFKVKKQVYRYNGVDVVRYICAKKSSVGLTLNAKIE